MSLECSSLGPISLGISELPGLPGSLFPSPDWGSSPSLCFQISFQFLLFLFAPCDLDVGTFNVVLEVPTPLLIFLNSCSSFFSGRMFLFSFCSKLLIWVPVSFLSLLVPCTFYFISLFIAFIFSSILWLYSTNSVSILITSVLNCAYDGITQMYFFWIFDLFLHLGHFFFLAVPVT